ncbi:hypothetical protein [Comamonas sp. MYb69]|uniref:hypothetical protein n=1 Tax=Comamonas sp. MYb69 TaxID=1848650 RepID=UPI0030ABF340
MRPNTHFQIEVERCGVEPIQLVAHAACEASAFATTEAHLRPGNVITIACLGEGVDYGNLIMEVSADGDIHLVAHEHRGFQVNGVSLEHALAALRFWLPLQERDSRLAWEDQ